MGGVADVEDPIGEEVPVALVYNGISHVVMMATPLDLEDFAVGFTLVEGIVERLSDIRGVETNASQGGIEVSVEIASQPFIGLKERRRNLAGRTGCGLCGTESLAQVLRVLPTSPNGVCVAPSAIQRAIGELNLRQPLHALTGAMHAAAWCRADGRVTLVREDVGRHNALDKVIGALASQGTVFAQGFAVVTSRASFELIQKAAMMGIPLLAAVSAPTALAIRTAKQCGMTLVGFARGNSLVAYANPHRIQAEDGSARNLTGIDFAAGT